MRQKSTKKVNRMDLITAGEIQKFAKQNLDYPNDINSVTTHKRKDGLTFYICTTGSRLFRPGYILAARYQRVRLILAPIPGTATEKDLELLISLIKVKDGVPNFHEVSKGMQAAGKLLKAEII